MNDEDLKGLFIAHVIWEINPSEGSYVKTKNKLGLPLAVQVYCKEADISSLIEKTWGYKGSVISYYRIY